MEREPTGSGATSAPSRSLGARRSHASAHWQLTRPGGGAGQRE